ncbi:MAG: methyltransferase domain-containing protein [Gemmatimonadota bacterium]|nr:MAG: methyltransferase domain-containing protein [Gemmatimonadota bacterium]
MVRQVLKGRCARDTLTLDPPSLAEKLARLATFGFSEQNFLGAPWIPLLFKLTPGRYRRRLALNLLAASPHYFKRYPHYASMARRQVLKEEHRRNVVSRRAICEQILQPHLRSDMTVLDFGCGPGNLARRVARHVERVIALDVSCGAIACAKVLNGAENIAYLVNDGRTLSALEDSSIDLIYSFAVVQHLSDELFDGFLREFRRVLKPGGGVICHVALEDAARQAESQQADASIRGRLESTFRLRMVYRPVAEVRRMIAGAGFSRPTVRPVSEICDVQDDIASQHLLAFHRS